MAVNLSDPALRSWVKSAHASGTDFPIQNLPYGIGRILLPGRTTHTGADVMVAIGDQALSLRRLADSSVLDGLDEGVKQACRATNLNTLMNLSREMQRALRERLSALLEEARVDTMRHRAAMEAALVPQRSVLPMLPAAIGDYTDFYASIFHATNVGKLFRPDNPLLPNYKYVPIGYHGRASSIVPSYTAIRRPRGQMAGAAGEAPTFGATRLLDYELEVGAFVARGNALGDPVPIDEAREHLFGLCLVNDWSARDIQSWEYQPLGPFLAKNFATTVSPWVVTLDALEPFRAPAFARPAEDPAPLPYLTGGDDQRRGGFDVQLEVYLETPRMHQAGEAPFLLSRSNLRELYWTLGQMVAHHTSNGCNLQTGDLLATGTVSGAATTARGCLLEITARGAQPVVLRNGETRKFLEDGDTVILRGYCEREGAARIGFGECRGTILPAR
jgi:fumarylacetoacetase